MIQLDWAVLSNICRRISPCAGKALDFFKSKVLPNGMVWELSHGQIDECDMVRALCSLTGVAELDAPDAFVTGSLRKPLGSAAVRWAVPGAS